MSNEIQSNEPSTTENVSSSKTDAAVEQVIDSAVGLGRLWARHGLTIGKLALEASATSLGTTAKMLSSLADAFASEEKDEEKAA